MFENINDYLNADNATIEHAAKNSIKTLHSRVMVQCNACLQPPDILDKKTFTSFKLIKLIL